MILSLILLVPLATALLIALIPSDRKAEIRQAALLGAGLNVILSLLVVTYFDASPGGDRWQFTERVPWVPEIGIGYHVGVDGISAVLVLLTSLVIFTGVLSSWKVEERTKEFFLLLMFLVTGVYGTFLSLDLFFFYFFYELAVIPMYLLIGIWGSLNKEYAATKLTLYISAGAILALLGVILIYTQADLQDGVRTFDIADLAVYAAGARAAGRTLIPIEIQTAIFPMLLFGFGVLAALWPLHTWSPVGYAAAPTAASMLHAGVLKKLGAFGLLRVGMILLPEGCQPWFPLLAGLCVLNILYCGYAAMKQRDMKFVIGYSSCSHMGYVLLGFATGGVMGISAGVYMIWAHGIMAAAAFSLIGHIYHEAHTKDLDRMSGLARKLPFVAAAFVFVGMANAGIPGTPNFVAELLVVISAWKKGLVIPAVAAVFGIVVSATYMLRMIRDALYGPEKLPAPDMKDARSLIERAPALILIPVLLVTGCYPELLLRLVRAGAAHIAGPIGGG